MKIFVCCRNIASCQKSVTTFTLVCIAPAAAAAAVLLLLLLFVENGRRPVGQPLTRWNDLIKNLGWNCLRLYPSEMMKVMEDCEV